MNTARQTMKTEIANTTTEMIVTALKVIGGGHMPVGQRMVRAELLDEYQRRLGLDAVLALEEVIAA